MLTVELPGLNEGDASGCTNHPRSGNTKLRTGPHLGHHSARANEVGIEIGLILGIVNAAVQSMGLATRHEDSDHNRTQR